jgi:hypothetical protein
MRTIEDEETFEEKRKVFNGFYCTMLQGLHFYFQTFYFKLVKVIQIKKSQTLLKNIPKNL